VLYLGNAIAPIQRYCWDKAGTESKLILDYLIDKKTDINIQSEGHATPLMIASCVGNEEIVRTLLRANAKPNVPGM
jgi:ankyrin repeat protein